MVSRTLSAMALTIDDFIPTFYPDLLSRPFIPTFYPDLFRQIQMNDFRCCRPLSSFCVISTCFSPKRWQIIVRVHKDCGNRFNQEQSCPIVKTNIPIPTKTFASFHLNIQMAVCLVASVLRRMTAKQEQLEAQDKGKAIKTEQANL